MVPIAQCLCFDTCKISGEFNILTPLYLLGYSFVSNKSAAWKCCASLNKRFSRKFYNSFINWNKISVLYRKFGEVGGIEGNNLIMLALVFVAQENHVKIIFISESHNMTNMILFGYR